MCVHAMASARATWPTKGCDQDTCNLGAPTGQGIEGESCMRVNMARGTFPRCGNALGTLEKLDSLTARPSFPTSHPSPSPYSGCAAAALVSDALLFCSV